MTLYWSGDGIELYHGDCREAPEWLTADVLITDPPYGIDWEPGSVDHAWNTTPIGRIRKAIANDRDTAARDAALECWGNKPGAVFADLRIPVPGSKQVLVYVKPTDAGVSSNVSGFRRDVEAIHLIGFWPRSHGGRSSVLRSGLRKVGGPTGAAARYGHPHAKPVDVMEILLAACPPGVIADPFAGSGSTLVAARNQGRRAIGVEIDERYAEMAARRLSQQAMVAP